MTPRRTARPRTQVERSETTRAELIGSARACFAASGYDAASLDEIAARAGVTKGALYHHFAGKQELFAAVHEEEHRRLAEIGATAYAGKTDRKHGLYEACRAFLEASLDPAAQRILLLDGPSVLGWDRVREIENRHSMRHLRLGLEAAMRDGIVAPRPVGPLVQLLNGAICEAAMYVARSEEPRSTLRQVLAELSTIIDALTRPPEAPPRRRAARRHD